MEFLTITKESIDAILPDRDVNTHKGNYGRVLLLCGSVGYTGAPALAALGALRSGAGLVYLGVPESIYAIEAGKLLEPIVLPLKDESGRVSPDAVEQVKELLPRMDAVLVGPGLGVSDGTFQIVRCVLEHYDGPIVLDADGINVLKSHMDILRKRTRPTIVTPHEGEFVRLGGDLSVGRTESAIALAQDLGVIVVLKGHRTFISDGNTHYVNMTGNPGMAVGGCGDVLAGILVSLLGQGINPLKAAACSVWLHGAAGDLCAEEISQYGMLPSDMIRVLPRLLR